MRWPQRSRRRVGAWLVLQGGSAPGFAGEQVGAGAGVEHCPSTSQLCQVHVGHLCCFPPTLTMPHGVPTSLLHPPSTTRPCPALPLPLHSPSTTRPCPATATAPPQHHPARPGPPGPATAPRLTSSDLWTRPPSPLHPPSTTRPCPPCHCHCTPAVIETLPLNLGLASWEQSHQQRLVDAALSLPLHPPSTTRPSTATAPTSSES